MGSRTEYPSQDVSVPQGMATSGNMVGPASSIDGEIALFSGTTGEILKEGPTIATLGSSIWPVGSIFLSAVSTNPHTLLGFGTWTQVGEGEVLVGQKTGDAHFAGAGDVAGSLITSVESGDGAALSGVGSPHPLINHTHTFLPPSYVLYVWERTL